MSSSSQVARSLLRARLAGSREHLSEEAFSGVSPPRRLAVPPPAARALAHGAQSPPPLAAAARAPAWVGISGGGEAAKELLDIMSNGGSGEPGGLPCSPPLRAANPLAGFELCSRFAELQAGAAAGPARAVGPDAKVKVVGFQTPGRFGTSA